MSVYRHPQVQAVYELHRHIIVDPDFFRSVKGELTLFVDNLWQHFKNSDARVAVEVCNYHPKYPGKSADDIMQIPLDLSDFQLTIAKEYGFADWADVVHHGNIAFDRTFERAIDLLLAGEKNELEILLQKHPDLVKQHSAYAHQAGLIHYVASNGVEIWRQVVPFNLPEMTEMLIAKGADVNMMHNIYGGNGSLAGLIESSAHPYAAGVAEALLKIVNQATT